MCIENRRPIKKRTDVTSGRNPEPPQPQIHRIHLFITFVWVFLGVFVRESGLDETPTVFGDEDGPRLTLGISRTSNDRGICGGLEDPLKCWNGCAMPHQHKLGSPGMRYTPKSTGVDHTLFCVNCLMVTYGGDV